MRLEVDALAGGVGGDEDAQRMCCRVGSLNARLISSRFSGRRRTVENFDARFGSLGFRDRCAELIHEVAPRVVVFGEDEDAQVVPFFTRAHVLANPIDEITHTRVGLAARGIGDAGHLVEQVALFSSVRTSRVANRSGCCGLDRALVKLLLLIFGECGTLVVSVEFSRAASRQPPLP